MLLSLSASSKEFVLFGLFRLDSSFDQFHQDAFVLVCWLFAIVRTRRARRGGRETLWRTGFFSSGHGAIVHHNEAMCTNLAVSFRTYSCGREISHYCGPKRDSSLRSE